MLGVIHRKNELALEARVTHSVTAAKFCGFVGRKVVGHADKTFDPIPYQQQTWWISYKKKLTWVLPLATSESKPVAEL